MPHNVTNQRVVVSFLKGERNETTNMWTDGTSLFSFEQKIAYRPDKGREVAIYNYTASGLYISQATSKHVALVIRQAKLLGVPVTLYHPMMGPFDRALLPR